MSLYLVGLLVEERADHAPTLQEALTKHGSEILCRSGIPSPDRSRGIISLVVETPPEKMQTLLQDLGDIAGVHVKSCLMS